MTVPTNDAVRQARREAFEEAARVCDLWAVENFRLADDTILTDPVLRGDASASAWKRSQDIQLEGAGHAYAAHAAKNMADAIRKMGEVV